MNILDVPQLKQNMFLDVATYIVRVPKTLGTRGVAVLLGAAGDLHLDFQNTLCNSLE